MLIRNTWKEKPHGKNSNYGSGVYQQLMQITGHLETVEKDSKKKIDTLNNRIDTLEKENLVLKEKKLLKEYNARLKSIINHDSFNTSLPPSTNQKGGKSVNTFHGRKKTGRKAVGQKGHVGSTFTKSKVEEKIISGRCRHEMKTISYAARQNYVKKYVIHLQIEPVITEIRIYADKNGITHTPTEYHSDVTYGVNVKA